LGFISSVYLIYKPDSGSLPYRGQALGTILG